MHLEMALELGNSTRSVCAAQRWVWSTWVVKEIAVENHEKRGRFHPRGIKIKISCMVPCQQSTPVYFMNFMIQLERCT